MIGKIPLNELIVTQTLSRELDQYRAPSSVARAALQLQAVGKTTKMGQRVQFLYTKTKDGVHAWDLPHQFNPVLIDVPRYKELLFRAFHEVLQPIGMNESVLRDWMLNRAEHEIIDIFQEENRLEPLPMDAALRLFSDPLQASA